MNKENNPRVYVGTYQKYNNGSIYGQWLDLTEFKNLESFYKKCQEIHKNEHDPEFMFQDYENINTELIDESWISYKIFDYIDLVDLSLDDDKKTAFDEFIEFSGYSFKDNEISDLIDHFEDFYQGNYESGKDYAETIYYEMTCQGEEHELDYYIDWDWVWNGKYKAAGYYITDNGNVFAM